MSVRILPFYLSDSCDASICLPNVKNSFSLWYLSILLKIWSRMLCALLPPAALLASPVFMESRLVTHLGVWGSSYWPYSRHPITFLSVRPQTSLGLALLFSSGHQSSGLITRTSWLWPMCHVSPFVWMPSTASTNSTESLLFFRAHFKVATL